MHANVHTGTKPKTRKPKQIILFIRRPLRIRQSIGVKVSQSRQRIIYRIPARLMRINLQKFLRDAELYRMEKGDHSPLGTQENRLQHNADTAGLIRLSPSSRISAGVGDERQLTFVSVLGLFIACAIGAN